MKKTVNLIEYLQMGGALSKLDLVHTQIMFLMGKEEEIRHIKSINYIDSKEVTEDTKFMVTSIDGKISYKEGIEILTVVEVKTVLVDKFINS